MIHAPNPLIYRYIIIHIYDNISVFFFILYFLIFVIISTMLKSYKIPINRYETMAKSQHPPAPQRPLGTSLLLEAGAPGAHGGGLIGFAHGAADGSEVPEGIQLQALGRIDLVAGEAVHSESI